MSVWYPTAHLKALEGAKGAKGGQAFYRVRLELMKTKNSTLAVQCPAFTAFAKLRLNPSTTLLSANCTYAKLRPILLGLQRFQAIHNPSFSSVESLRQLPC